MTVIVEHQSYVSAPPEAVWRVLVDFAHWGDWHPHRELFGEAKLGARVDHLMRQPTTGRRQTPSRIDVLEDHGCLSFRFGRRWYGYSFERFRLEPWKSGTRLILVTETPRWMVKLKRPIEEHETVVRAACDQVAAALGRRFASGSGKSRAGLSRRGRL